MTPARTLALDLGEKKVGLAISDPLGITAQPLEVIRPAGKKQLIDHIKNVIRERGVGRLVLGLPLNMDGKAGEKARDVCAFAEELKAELGVPVCLWDERLTTMEVNRIMIRADISRKKRKKADDKLAAQLILQNYLDASGRKT